MIQVLRRVTRGRGWMSFALLVISQIKELPFLLWPLCLGLLIDAVEQGQGVGEKLLWVGGGYVTALIFGITGAYVFHRIHIAYTHGLALELRNELITHLERSSPPEASQIAAGRIQTKLVDEVDDLVKLPGQAIEVIVDGVVTITTCAVVVGLQAPVLFPAVVVMLGFTVLLAWASRRVLALRSAKARHAFEKMGLMISDLVRLFPFFRSHAISGRDRLRLAAQLERVRSTAACRDRAGALLETTSLIGFGIIQFVTVAFALILAHRGYLSTGTIVTVSTYLLTMGYWLGTASEDWQDLIEDAETWDALKEIFDLPSANPTEGTHRATRVRGELVAEAVCYRYPSGTRDAIHELSLRIEPGSTVGLVGASGSGKTTLQQLLGGIVSPTAGRLSVDGVPVEIWSRNELIGRFACVQQEPELCNGSVRDNLCLGLADVPDDATLQRLLESLGCWSFVKELPSGLDSRLGDGGGGLSGGQQQRLTIARAMLRDPQVLMLDEPTSTLDPESQAEVRKTIAAAMAGRTTIIATHSIPIMCACDRLVVLAEGRIAAEGPPALLARDNDGFFGRAVRGLKEQLGDVWICV